jgi:SAM-dependent methyltransferase
MIEAYYDNLAPFYKLIFQDWEASVRQQASALKGVIQEHFGNQVSRILDAACGIGTQCIGLAELGYSLTASDLSHNAVSMARAEAGKRGLHITFAVADLPHLSNIFLEQFDLVIACDNVIPHLLSEEEILKAFLEFHHCTTPKGGCIISVRDYVAIGPIGTQIYPRTVHIDGHRRVILFDLLQGNGDFYDFTTYVVEHDGSEPATTHAISGGRYFCVTISKLENILRQAGFANVVTLRDRYYQPLLLGLKSAEQISL